MPKKSMDGSRLYDEDIKKFLDSHSADLEECREGIITLHEIIGNGSEKEKQEYAELYESWGQLLDVYEKIVSLLGPRMPLEKRGDLDKFFDAFDGFRESFRLNMDKAIIVAKLKLRKMKLEEDSVKPEDTAPLYKSVPKASFMETLAPTYGETLTVCEEVISDLKDRPDIKERTHIIFNLNRLKRTLQPMTLAGSSVEVIEPILLEFITLVRRAKSLLLVLGKEIEHTDSAEAPVALTRQAPEAPKPPVALRRQAPEAPKPPVALRRQAPEAPKPPVALRRQAPPPPPPPPTSRRP